MPIESFESLLTQLTRDDATSPTHGINRHNVIPLVENRMQFTRVLDIFGLTIEPGKRDERPGRSIRSLFLRHCNLFELADLMELARQRGIATYVNIDHIDGIHADSAGLRHITEVMHVKGIASNNPRILVLGKSLGLETIQRIFALDSTGLDTALESVDAAQTDLLDISPALVVPHIAQTLKAYALPFLASGLIQMPQQIPTIVRSGAAGVIAAREDLWA